MTADTKKFFCTDLAWEYGIPLVGTATRGDIWFLLEYTGRWGVKAFEESTLPQEVGLPRYYNSYHSSRLGSRRLGYSSSYSTFGRGLVHRSRRGHQPGRKWRWCW